MPAKIVTLHPQGKQGVNIAADKYEMIKSAIIAVLQEHQPVTFSALVNHVKRNLTGKFDGSIPWYVTTVKLDLEARAIIRRIPGRSPQRLTLM